MPDSVPMTREAFDREKARLDEMKNVERPRIAERVAAAREEGDLKENQEYKGQREQLAHLERKIGVLADKLSRAEIVDPSSIKRDEIAFGATVVVNDLDYGDEEEFTFVGAGDEDYDANRYLITSPIGKGLVGKKVGDQVEIEVPKGKLRFEVLDIRYEDF